MKLPRPLSALFSNAKVPYTFMKKGTPTELAYVDTRIAEWQSRRSDIVAGLKENVQFEQVLPGEENQTLHDKLFENEKVHPLPSVEELVEQRIGGTNANKRCYARVNRNQGKEEVTTGIFIALREIDAPEGNVSYNDISGNINGVKDTPIEDFTPEEGATVEAILYTISGQHPWDKGGRELAAQVYEYLHSEAAEKNYNLIISTLSPVREFTPHLQKQEGFENLLDEDGEVSDEFMMFMQSEEAQEELEHRLLRYLIMEKDPVLNFHLGNGAYIGDVKFNPENKEDWVMVNYVYPDAPEELAQNQKAYKDGMRVLAPHLHEFLGDELNVLEAKVKMFGQRQTDEPQADHTAG